MRLAAAAAMFNRAVCFDGYSGDPLFKAQLGLYDDNKRDSETAQRRVLSIAPGTDLPVRRVVALDGSRFILGRANPDDFRGKTVRIGYVAHEVTELSTVRSLAQVCLDQAGFSAWAGRAWLKNAAYAEQGSQLVPQYHIHFAPNEPVPVQSTVAFGGRLHVVRSTEPGPAGTLVCTCDELPEPTIETAASVLNGTYDPVLDTISGTPQTVRLMRVRWQSIFQYRNQAAPKFGPEDMQVVIAKASLTLKPGAVLTLSDGTWKVKSVQSEADVWLAHATRHV